MKTDPGYEVLPGEVEIWRGKQWAVTSHVLTSFGDREYWIDKGRLGENLSGHSWLEHLAAKGWVDLEDFIAAYCVALAVHYPRKIDRTALLAAIERGRDRDWERAAWERKEAADGSRGTALFSGQISPPCVAGDTVFSFETSGFQGGDQSRLKISIEGGSAMMDVGTDGEPLSGGGSAERSLAVVFYGDIELRAAAEGLEFLSRRIKQALS